MAFRGWPAEAIAFFEGLEADNSKTYWQEHKSVYERSVRGPMDDLLAELAEEFGESKVFRPYRDVRFSKDKSPYKTYMAATLSEGGYLSLSAEGLGVGTGYYQPASDQLDRYRRAVADDQTGIVLEKVIAKASRAGIEVSGHEELKIVPRGYDKQHPRADLLRQKGLIAWKQWEVGPWLATKSPKKRIVDVLHAAQPLRDWLDTNVGPSTVAEYRAR
jgi:uncharacterized protein (TIGR02453 family)